MPIPFPSTLFSSAGFSDPTSIAGLQVWFDAADSGSITQSGGAVSQWNDKSGNANHATQATGAKQPTVASAAQNGKDTLLFTAASSQYFGLTTRISSSSSDPHTSFFVGKRAASSGKLLNLGADVGLSGTNAVFDIDWFSDDRIYASTSTGYQVTTSTYTDTTAYHILYVTHTSNTMVIYYDGASVGSSFNAAGRSAWIGNVGADSDNLGNYIYSNGNFGEIIRYNSVLSAGDLSSVYNYLKSKWGL